MARDWLTAREIAQAVVAHGVKGLPTSERGVQKLAQRSGWTELPATLCRPREGREGGGGLEFRLLALPDLPPALERALGRDATHAGRDRAVAVREADAQRQVAAVGAFDLSARQRQVMEARGQVLTAIAAQEAAHGVSRARAIAVFLASVERGDATLREAFGLAMDVVRLANDRGGPARSVGRSTVYGWFRAWGEQGARALAPVPTRAPGTPPPGWDAYLRHRVRQPNSSDADCLRTYMATVSNPAFGLTLDQVRYWLRGMGEIERCAGRVGALAMKARRAYVIRSFDHLLPSDVYVADGHTFDAEVLDPTAARAMRPEITTVLDVATRRIVAIAISRKENVIAVTEALRNASIGHGIPAIFYSDNGAGYRNKALDQDAHGLMARLGTHPAHSLPYAAQAKGVIERLHHTVWVRLAKRLPSYIGAPADREAKDAVHKRTRADLKLTGQSALLPSWEAFRGLCQQEVQAYNASAHSSLPKIADPETGKRRPMSPDEAWAAHVAQGFEPVTVEPELGCDLFRPLVERVVQRGMVAWNNNRYAHPALAAHEGARVLAGYDDADGRHLWMREMDRATGQPGPLICVAEFAGGAEYFPRSQVQAAQERRTKAQLARIEVRRQGKLAELRPAALIEGLAAVPMSPLPETTLSPDPVPVPANDARPQPRGRARGAVPASAQEIDTDEALAAWALAGGDLDEQQLWVLRDCLSRESKRQVLAGQGVDVETLADVVRAHASPGRTA